MTTPQEKLRTLKLANDAYSRGQPFFSEEEYHELWREVRELDPNNPELYHTARDPHYTSSTRPHLFTIMGTQKAFEMDEMRPFLKRFKDEPLLIEPKYDGLAAMLYATEDGSPLLIKFGDGVRGEDISHHVPKIQLPELEGRQYLPVEILIPWSKWNPDWGKNPRNVAAGWIARHELEHSGILEAVPHEGGPLVYLVHPPHDLDQLSTLFLELYSQWRVSYPMDGLMIKAANSHTRTVVSHNGTVSLWSVAWKPPMQLAWTRVNQIEWRVSRSGRVVPRVHYEPIDLCGTTNHYATGNNAQWVYDRELHVGAQILVGKAGEIIPQIIEVRSEHAAELPYNCPICGDWLEDQGVDLKCTSDQCLGQVHKQLVHFCSEHGMEIKEVGPAMLEQLLQHKEPRELLIEKPWALLEPDTFELTPWCFKLWGDATTQRYLANLRELNQSRDPAWFISALGYRGLGYKTALKCFQTLKGQQTKGSLQHEAVMNFTRAYYRFKQALEELKYFSFAPLPQQPVATYCITGTLSASRSEIIQWLSSYNWQFVNSVTRYTNYLIVGEKNKETVKEKRAKELGVTIVYEHQLPTLLKKEQNDERRESSNNQTDS